MKPDNVAAFGDVLLDKATAASIQQGTLKYTYRGVPMLKSPFDLAIYMQLIWEIKPKTVLEFGSKSGGSALWLADVLANFGLGDCILKSYDIHPVTTLKDPRIEFSKIDVSRPQDFIEGSVLNALPHPILIIDDASHQYTHLLTLLRFLHPHLKPGDYLIIEDGILSHLGLEERYEGGPLRAIQEFLAAHGGCYAVDRNRCDTFGKNMTWNVEGYLRRIA